MMILFKKFLVLFICLGFLCIANINKGYANDWIYTIVPGDNLWTLADRYLIKISYWQRLQKLNKIADPWKIPPGTKLRIPVEWIKKYPIIARVHSVNGQATVLEADREEYKTLTVGTFLFMDELIKTGADSNVILEFVDGSTLLLQSDSLLKLNHLSVYGKTEMTDTRLRLEQGRLETQVEQKKGAASRFEISTPAGITSVRGTDYRLSAEQIPARSRTEVLTGGVNVHSGGANLMVPEGYGTIVAAGQPPSPPIKLLPPPDVTSIPVLLEQVPIQFILPSLSGAQGYRVQIADNQLFDEILFDRQLASNLFIGPDLPDGKYYSRLRGIDVQGLEGENAEFQFILNARPVAPFPVLPKPDAILTEQSPNFEWTGRKTVTTFHFQIAKDTDFNNLIVDLADYTKVRLSINNKLDPGHYFWRVSSFNELEGQGPYSDIQTFRRILPAPEMEEPEIGNESIFIRWQAGLPGQRFQIQFAADESFAQLIIDKHSTKPELELARPASGDYFLRVRAIYPDGFIGPFSESQIINVPQEGLYWWLLLLPLLALLAL